MALTLNIQPKQIFGLVEQLPTKEKQRLKHILDIQLIDNKNFITKNDSVLKVISESKTLLSLGDNWDEEGALAIPEDIWKRAIKFLKNYSEYILQDKFISIQAPQINPCRDGSIDLSWRTPKARMLINFKNDKSDLAHYYGDYYNNINSIKGYVKTDEIQEFLATWMKILA
ncbi:MAG: hypothetical protein ACK4YV_09965 [Emticicia sp.]